MQYVYVLRYLKIEPIFQKFKFKFWRKLTWNSWGVLTGYS